jgi:DNA-binding transcriptional LysR family regulator
MDLKQLRCFVAAAQTLHFGDAARELEMLPAMLGRQIQALETSLRARLFRRSTRHVALTDAGRTLLPHARRLLADADSLALLLNVDSIQASSMVRVGAIDSAAAGLMPQLLRDLRDQQPELDVTLVEDRTVRLIPKLNAGQLDLIFVRPPDFVPAPLSCRLLFYEQALVALPAAHQLASRGSIAITDLASVAMIIPSRRSRPHSHDLTVDLFGAAGIALTVAQEASEKHTILGLVGAGIGCAIVPRSSALAGIGGVAFRPIAGDSAQYRLPLAAMWHRAAPDNARDAVIACLLQRLDSYAATA